MAKTYAKDRAIETKFGSYVKETLQFQVGRGRVDTTFKELLSGEIASRRIELAVLASITNRRWLKFQERHLPQKIEPNDSRHEDTGMKMNTKTGRPRNSGKGASIDFIKDHFAVVALSGNAHRDGDYRAFARLEPESITDVHLGALVKEALARSRNFESATDAEIDYFYNVESPAENKKWLDSLMARFKTKTVQALYRNSRRLSVRQKETQITVIPIYEIRGGGGRGSPEDQYIVLDEPIEDEALGKAIRLGLSRCK